MNKKLDIVLQCITVYESLCVDSLCCFSLFLVSYRMDSNRIKERINVRHSGLAKQNVTFYMSTEVRITQENTFSKIFLCFVSKPTGCTFVWNGRQWIFFIKIFAYEKRFVEKPTYHYEEAQTIQWLNTWIPLYLTAVLVADVQDRYNNTYNSSSYFTL